MLTTAFISYRISCRSNQGSCRRADRQHGRCLGPRQQNPTDPSLKNATVCEQDHSSLSVATYPAIWRPPSSIIPGRGGAGGPAGGGRGGAARGPGGASE